MNLTTENCQGPFMPAGNTMRLLLVCHGGAALNVVQLLAACFAWNAQAASFCVTTFVWWKGASNTAFANSGRRFLIPQSPD
jgi:hypothetical protein